MTQQVTDQPAAPTTATPDRPGEHNNISLDDLKKIRGGVGEPSMPVMASVEKSDEDFAKPVA